MIPTVKDAFEKATNRQKLYHSLSQIVIDRVYDGFQEILSKIQLDNNEDEPELVLTKLKPKLDSLLQTIQLHKEMNISLEKFVKLLEGSYHPDISRASQSFDFDIHQVNKLLVCHLYREGLFDIGDCLVKEAELEEETEVRSQSLEIFQLTESMKLGNIKPAMIWISANREQLKQNGSLLELKLLSLKYFEMLREGNCFEALKYARTHFLPYASFHWKEVKKLSTALLWDGKLEKSPYAEMVSAFDCDTITKELTNQYYQLLNQPFNSPLEVAFSMGLKSLPILLKLDHVMGLKKQEHQEIKQLPVPEDEFEFQSVFVCPVSKDKSSEENPAMMMTCGHVLCEETIMRICKQRSRRFKCPYCTAETLVAACRRLYF